MSSGRLIDSAPHPQTAGKGPAAHPHTGGKSLDLYPNIARSTTGGKEPRLTKGGKQPRSTVAGKGPMPPPKASGRKKKPSIVGPNVKASRQQFIKKTAIKSLQRSNGAPAVHRALGSEAPLQTPAPPTSVAEYINPRVPNSLVLSGTGWSIHGLASLNKTLDSSGDQVRYFATNAEIFF